MNLERMAMALPATLIALSSCHPTETIPASPERATRALTLTPVAKINFQPATTPVPVGYTADTGLPFDASRGFGWFRQDSLSSTHVPLDITPNTRTRGRTNIDPRLDTLIHLQYPTTRPPNVTTPAAWEIVVPNGNYRVTVSVGDNVYDSFHVIHAENVPVIGKFKGSSNPQYRSGTADIVVSDGRLTLHATGGSNTKLNYVDIHRTDELHPSITTVSPYDGETGVSTVASVRADQHLPNGGVDENTVVAGVKLFNVATGAEVPANANTSGGGDSLILTPLASLAANTRYEFRVTAAVSDGLGRSFIPFVSRFTTGAAEPPPPTNVRFTKVALANASGKTFISAAIGPDRKLYASTQSGEIMRYPINADGTLGVAETILTIKNAEGTRAITGLAFPPGVTASNLTLWITHGAPVPTAFKDSDPNTWAPDWSGKLTRLSGPDLATRVDYVVGLPRSVKDHMTNSLAFKGTDANTIYISQGSNAANGAADRIWGNRPERQLTGAILKVDLTKITAPPVNVKTEEGGSYDAFALNAPVSLFATGVRNAFDLVWHSNGQLYVPTNGSGSNGNAPATPTPLPASCTRRIDKALNGDYTAPQVPGLSAISTAQVDYLFRVVAGGYYGHPNPARCEWVLNGGNPTSGADRGEILQYAAGVLPDRNYRGFSWDFGLHYSTNGALEYKSNVFGDALRGKLIVTRFSAGKDLIVLTVGTSQEITAATTGLTGMSGFGDPLDVVEDPTTGNLYVTEYSGRKITLLQPTP